MKKGFIIIVLFTVLFVGCQQQAENSKETTPEQLQIKPGELFEGELKKIEPHLGFVGSGLVEVAYNGSKKYLQTDYEIWEDGQLKERVGRFSSLIGHKFDGNISITLEEAAKNDKSYRGIIAISSPTGYSASSFFIPKIDSDYSYGPMHIKDSITIGANEEAIIWGMHANENGLVYQGDIENTAKKADWAFLVKVSTK